MEEEVLAIIQARTNSTRLPGKVLRTINGKTLLETLLSRLSLSKTIDKIIVAIPENKKDDTLAEKINCLGYQIFRGSENNVLERFYNAARTYPASTIVRITADCPLIDPNIVDKTISCFLKKKVDYTSNNNPPTFPDGLDVEVFSFQALEKSAFEASSTYDREHVTSYMKNSRKFKKFNYVSKINYSQDRWTVDEESDFLLIKDIINHFHPNINFRMEDILKFKNRNPKIFRINSKIQRNEGSSLGQGQKLYLRAKNIMPGGTSLFSKRAELFLPKLWPSYFLKSKGCNIWDLDGKKYTDMSYMGIGTNILGYNHPEVDNAVKEVVLNGNMTTLNCPEEVYLAEELLNLHPWAGMVKFSRSGGEANNIAIRIARAATGKSRIAFCGYHGWHDWYLSANLSDESKLDQHLIKGIGSKGIPNWLADKSIPFPYNDFESLEKLDKIDDLGVLIMEVERNFAPAEGYLEEIRYITAKNNIILIFDECTSGFRETFGGLHKKYKVEPDMAMFGKALGNGYAINAVLGKKNLFEAANNTFISSVFWTERIGFVAGLQTLKTMEKESSWENITNIGINIRKKWLSLAQKYELDLAINGLNALSAFKIKSPRWLKYKTYITQEMLKKGFLASNAIYASIAHKKEDIEKYFYHLEPIFTKISDFENGKNVDDYLETEVCQDHFKRLN